MLCAVASLLLTAGPISVAVPGVGCVGLDAKLCDSFLDRFVVQLTDHRHVRVVAQKDIAQLLGLERQRQLLGCADAAANACLAELAGALGVDGLVSMSITKSDPYFVATARLVRSSDGSQWASGSERVEREGQLFDAMDRLAARLGQAIEAPAAPLETVETAPRPRRSLVPFVPGMVGVAAAGTGLAVFLSAGTERGRLASHAVPEGEVQGVISSGRQKEQLGVALIVSGGACIAASALWAVLAPGAAPAVALAPAPGGATVALGATW
jgi:hypothetical protein